MRWISIAGLVTPSLLALAAASSAELVYPQGGQCSRECGAGHAAIDIAGAAGTPVSAARADRVIASGPSDQGTKVLLLHEAGYATAYADLDLAGARPVG